MIAGTRSRSRSQPRRSMARRSRIDSPASPTSSRRTTASRPPRADADHAGPVARPEHVEGNARSGRGARHEAGRGVGTTLRASARAGRERLRARRVRVRDAARLHPGQPHRHDHRRSAEQPDPTPARRLRRRRARCASGRRRRAWSSTTDARYALGIARSSNGTTTWRIGSAYRRLRRRARSRWIQRDKPGGSVERMISS